jgi:ABC-type transporter Mla subunit MlaD
MLGKTEQVRYYRIGLFVVVGCILLAGFLLMVVGSDWLHQSTQVESYFDESVQGLHVGSSVKFRGVTVGQVKKISFMGDGYQQATSDGARTVRYVYVQMTLKTLQFLDDVAGSVQIKLEHAISHGLRIHLAQQGLTGNAYLELDFESKPKSVLAVTWQPKSYYIPSRPSTLGAVTSSINTLFSGLEDVDFKSIFSNAKQATVSFKESMAHIQHVLWVHQGNIDRTIDNVGHLTQDLRLILESMSVSPRGFVGTQSWLNTGGK